MDRRCEFPAIHQFVFYKPLAVNNDGKEEYQLFYHEVAEPEYGLINYEDDSFTLIENELYELLKRKDKQLNYASYAYPIEGEDTVFFIVSAVIDDHLNLCIMAKIRNQINLSS